MKNSLLHKQGISPSTSSSLLYGFCLAYFFYLSGKFYEGSGSLLDILAFSACNPTDVGRDLNWLNKAGLSMTSLKSMESDKD